MAEEIKQWEYRVQTVGGTFGTRDDDVQSILDEWGMEGWEAVNVYSVGGTGKVTLVAKRPLTERARRLKSLPQM